MAGKCFLCKKNEAVGLKEISFMYEGIKFFFKEGPGTCEKCEKREAIRRFEEFGRKFISLKDGKLKIDWKFYSEAYWHERDGHLVRILEDLGIFSRKSEGNWELVTSGVCWLNPIKFGSVLYFTREEDVIEFARLNYGRVSYPCSIRQIGKVLSVKKISEG